MDRKKRYGIDGLVFDIPLIETETPGEYIEDYTDLIENPKTTPCGGRIILSYDEPCELYAGKIEECSLCENFKKAFDDSLIGICNKEETK